MSYSLSPQGLSLILEHEGFLAAPKLLPTGEWVVGHGHVRAGAPGAPVAKSEAEALLRQDLEPFVALVNEVVTHKLTQAQFDALVSFAFSVGAETFVSSHVLRRVNSGDVIAAAGQLDAWRKTEASGALEAAPALIRRRAAEKALLLSGLDCEAAPSAFLRPQLDHAAAVLGAPVKYPAPPELASLPDAPMKPTPEVVVVDADPAPAADELLLTEVVDDDFVEPAPQPAPEPVQPVMRPVDYAREALRRAQAEQMRDQGAAGDWRRKAEALSASAASWVVNLRGFRKV